MFLLEVFINEQIVLKLNSANVICSNDHKNKNKVNISINT